MVEFQIPNFNKYVLQCVLGDSDVDVDDTPLIGVDLGGFPK